MSASAHQPAVSWKEVTEERYWDMLEILMPAFQDGSGFLVGEPYTHRICAETGQVSEACRAFYETSGRFFEASDPMTAGEFRAVRVVDVLSSAGGGEAP